MTCISIVKEYSVITQRTKIGLFEFLKNHIFVHDTGFHNLCIYVENVSLRILIEFVNLKEYYSETLVYILR